MSFYSKFLRPIANFLGLQPKQETFSFEKAESKLLGVIHRPVADVALWSQEDQSWQKVRMLVDTGADYTILPRYLAGLLGIDLKKARRVDTEGVGGKQTIYLVENIKTKLGVFERNITVGFLPRSNIPPLMGRYHFLETFKVCFKKNKSVAFS